MKGGGAALGVFLIAGWGGCARPDPSGSGGIAGGNPRPRGSLVADGVDLAAPGALALDAAGTPHLLYRDGLGGRLARATLAPDRSWGSDTVDPSGGAGFASSLVFDPSLGLTAFYWDRDADEIRSARPGPSGWTSGVVVSGASLAGGPLAAPIAASPGPAGTIHLVYEEVRGGETPVVVHLTWGEGGAGPPERIAPAPGDPLPLYPASLCLAASPEGKLAVGWHDGNASGFVAAVSSPSGWTLLPLSLPGSNVGYSCSLAWDSSGKLHAAYWDANGRSVGSAEADPAWSAEVVDDASEAGTLGVAMILRGGKSPLLAYGGGEGGDLLLALLAPSGWERIPFDTPGIRGYRPMLAARGGVVGAASFELAPAGPLGPGLGRLWYHDADALLPPLAP